MPTINDDNNFIFKALRAGASGYLLKSAPVDQTMATIRESYQGGTLSHQKFGTGTVSGAGPVSGHLERSGCGGAGEFAETHKMLLVK